MRTHPESSPSLPKRLFDLSVATVLFVALFPVMLLVLLSVWAQDGGNPVYGQTRVGRGGRPFRMWKFRTMVVDADAKRGPLVAQASSIRFKRKDDPRITPLGRMLRRWSADELPQLVNVLRGEMSIVGPRPPLPEEVAHYTPRERGRLSVRPGLTGPWQVMGRSELDFDTQVRLDLEYVAAPTVIRDVMLLVRTVPAVLIGRGAW